MARAELEQRFRELCAEVASLERSYRDVTAEEASQPGLCGLTWLTGTRTHVSPSSAERAIRTSMRCGSMIQPRPHTSSNRSIGSASWLRTKRETTSWDLPTSRRHCLVPKRPLPYTQIPSIPLVAI